jgi:hypothetical protein
MARRSGPRWRNTPTSAWCSRAPIRRPKFEGLTSFFINMKSPGVEVRPIRQASGEAEFNEVFLEDVFVPDSQRVGAVGAGWKVTLTGLMSERLSIGGVMPAELWCAWSPSCCAISALGRRQRPRRRPHARAAGRPLPARHMALWLLQCRGLTALGMGRRRRARR